MAQIDGFWSYVHVDDDAESGRIADLARDVAAQFEMLTGEAINLFLDRDNLTWGDDWRPKIDDGLSSIAFFIPVITPRYFKSAECRRELNFFARNAEKLGVKELVLPILYVDFPGLHEDPQTDDLMALVARFQWVDWTSLRFADRQSGDYKRAVSGLAERLVAANAAADQAVASGEVIAAAASAEAQLDESGTLDKLGLMETALPDLTETVLSIGQTIEEIGRAMSAAAGDIDKQNAQGSGIAARLTVARKLSEGLVSPAREIRAQGNHFATLLHDVDEGVRIIIQGAPAEVEATPGSKANFEEFFATVRNMVAQSEVGLGAVRSMVETLEPLEKSSRDLRGPIRTLREGLTLLVEGLNVMRAWISLMDEVSLA
ncbi:toll/interleukin-1 receptor domain-containing protein [Curtobacterium oceanosedimentum]|uniref:toll/interleukin-1 receptor domain-containing protein n=1 Tax=Curtobacterium oceanosedimentum TaxID=465820 RepID=UPI001CE17292|nr:toll/interleukin-1 receptor domain-containing protein [Curtobacterium oceanosedimentum]MCA5923795.1 toll/interleukin-1 receptor domain-containing protein [Curtobacterium oceanosedimentum]